MAEALREKIGATLTPVDREKLEHLLLPVKRSLGEEAVQVAISEGRAISLEDAITYSLQDS